MLTCQKHLFQLDEDFTYINGAYQSPLLNSVVQAGHDAIDLKVSPNRLMKPHFFDPVEEGKSLFAQLINYNDVDRIAVVPSASYAASTIAANIKLDAHQNVVIIAEQFPSNFYPWMRLTEENGATLKQVTAGSGDHKTESWNNGILSAIDEQTVVVAMPILHWAEGIIYDLKSIRKRCDEVGALLIIDGTQSIGVMPFEMHEIRPDALFCASYKWLLGPYGFGYAYYGAAFDHGKPIEDNWINRDKSDDFQNLVQYNSNYKSIGHKYSMGGQSNFIYNAMMIPALKQILEWTPKAMTNYITQIGSTVKGELRQHGFEVDGEAASHLFRIGLPNQLNLEEVKQILFNQKIHVSYRGTGIRVSPSVYNTQDDLEKLKTTLIGLI